MIINDILKEIATPSIYKRDGKSCYYDIFRKKLIEITPEEKIRQKVALMFNQKYDVPKEMISLEVPMSYYVEGAKGRADIVIETYDSKAQLLYPLTVIECKNENVPLTNNVMDQAKNYCDTIGAKYIVVTNGNELLTAVYDEKTDDYNIIDSILTYSDMIDENYEIYRPPTRKIIRFSLKQLNDIKLISDYNYADNWIFGKDSNDQIKKLSINMFQCFMDTNHILPSTKRKSFELIEDIGIRISDYSNAGGGHYNGDYRAFLVKDRLGESQIVSMALFGTDPNFRDEHRRSYCSLIVAIDKFKVSHNSLQYNVDDYSNFTENGFITFEHNGLMSNYKKADVLSYVKANTNNLTFSIDKIIIGRIKNDTLLYLDNPDVSELIYNFIEYALLREELRKKQKEHK